MAAVSNCYTVKVHSRFDAFLDNDISDDFPEEIFEKIQRDKEVKDKIKKEKPAKKAKTATKELEKLSSVKDNVKETIKEKEPRPGTPPETRNKSYDQAEKPPRFGGHKNDKVEDSENVPPQEFHSSRGRGRGEFSGSRGGRGRGSRGDFGGSRGGTEFRRGSRGGYRGGPRNDRGPREENNDNFREDFANGSQGSRSSRGNRRGGNRGHFGDQERNDSEEMQIDSFVPEPADSENRPERPPSRGSRGGFRGRGRGGRGHGGRDFDRHSGSDKTGIKPTDKKEGGGAHNWGSVQDEVEEVIDQADQEATEKADTSAMDETPMPEDWADVKDDDKQDSGPEAVVEMTLDEWKAKQGLNRVHVQANAPESNNQRKANDGKDLFGDMVAYRKPKEQKNEDDSDMEEMENDEDVKKKMIPIDIRFNDHRTNHGGFERERGRGERRGRGVPRGGDRFEERRGRGGSGRSFPDREQQNEGSGPRPSRGGFDGESRRGSGRGGRGRGDRDRGDRDRGDRGDRGRGSRGGRGGQRGGPDVNIRLDDEMDFPTLK